MKENAKKTLLLLYTKPSEPYFFATAQLLKSLMPLLSDSGHRSLLSLLKSRGLITSESILGETTYRITTTGLASLKTALPAMVRSELQWEGTWACLVFKQAPPGDQQFRYLRTLLVKYQSLALARGVYLYPDAFPTAVITEIETRYSKAVSLFQLGKWLSDDERQIAIEHYGLSDLIQTYSGISNEIERLTSRKRVNKALNQQEKTLLSSLFNRLYEILSEDMGLILHYFPQVKSGAEVLSEFQSVCREFLGSESE